MGARSFLMDGFLSALEKGEEEKKQRMRRDLDKVTENWTRLSVGCFALKLVMACEKTKYQAWARADEPNKPRRKFRALD